MRIEDAAFTRLTELAIKDVFRRGNYGYPPWIDCPVIVQHAVRGIPPRRPLRTLKEMVVPAWPVFVGIVLVTALFPTYFLPFWWKVWVYVACVPILAIALAFSLSRSERKRVDDEKALFDDFEANPDLFKDEILKAAVERLPDMDFFGKTNDKVPVGTYELELIQSLREVGLPQERTVRCIGRPYFIHQYEVKELDFKNDEGERRNYVIDVAVLWPERRIKYALEVDGDDHRERKWKDRNRNRVLTERGWFVRRFHHSWMCKPIKVAEGAREVLSLIYFFAKYASNRDLDQSTDGIAAWAQHQQWKRRDRGARK